MNIEENNSKDGTKIASAVLSRRKKISEGV